MQREILARQPQVYAAALAAGALLLAGGLSVMGFGGIRQAANKT